MASSISPAAALRKFGFKQTIKGAVIVALLVSLMVCMQGIAYAETFTDEKSRAELAASMSSAPALGIIYGEAKNIPTAAGYMVYRTVAVMSLVVALWGLLTATKLLRGQEEDGRLEAIISKGTTLRGASWHMFTGFALSMLVSFVIAALLIISAGQVPTVDASVYSCTLIALAIFLPGIFFASVGIFTSQLSVTRRRATLYGLIPLIFLFLVRGIGNTMADWYWLKDFTPFGWSDRLDPVMDPHVIWAMSFLLAIPIVWIGLYFSKKRDYGTSLIKESSVAKSKNILLGSPGQLALRQQIGMFIAWGIAAVSITALIAAVAEVAAKSVSETPELAGVIAKLGGSINDIKIAFLGAGMMFTVLVLLIMTTVSLAAIRSDEAKQYLDNLLVQPVKRSVWLATRLIIIVGAFLTISLICGLVTFLITTAMNINIDVANLFLVSIALIGTVVFLLGIGTLLYGILPRIAAIMMYAVIAWSFLVNIIVSIVDLGEIVAKSSLFYYVSLSPGEAPDWTTFAWLVSLGIIMAAVGIFAFSRRDIIPE